MGLYTMETMQTISPKEEENLPIIKDKYMKVSGKLVLSKEKGFGKVFMVKITWVFGKQGSLKVMEFLLARAAADMRASSRMP